MEIYVVKENDTLEKIANLYNVAVIDIIRINGLVEPYKLVVGETLSIPVASYNVFDYYVVKDNDTLYSIAKNYNTHVNTLAEINGLNLNDYIYKGQTLLVPKRNIKTYITKEGDTLTSVSKYFNVTKEKLIDDNKIIYLLPEQLLIYRQ